MNITLLNLNFLSSGPDLSKYPHTDDDDLGNKDLDTWIPETKLASLMIEP
jgi:hypothetical protein